MGRRKEPPFSAGKEKKGRPISSHKRNPLPTLIRELEKKKTLLCLEKGRGNTNESSK